MSLRIGAVSYLNTKPLIHSLYQDLRGDRLVLDLPSRLADQLAAGDLDVALIPSVEYLRRRSELAIVSNACIACRGPVRSVQLLFRKPPEQVRTLALDEGSRTSAVLAQVLLFQRLQIRPECLPLPIADSFVNCQSDALLVIGDRAMNIDRSRYVECWDLGEHWNEWAQLPFVFAMWVARRSDVSQIDIVRAEQELERSRDTGLQNLLPLAQRYAPEYGLSVNDCLRYFQSQLHFILGDRERAGLSLFEKYAEQLGLLAITEIDGCSQPRMQSASTGCH